jgi:hypothetical protein
MLPEDLKTPGCSNYSIIMPEHDTREPAPPFPDFDGLHLPETFVWQGIPRIRLWKIGNGKARGVSLQGRT